MLLVAFVPVLALRLEAHKKVYEPAHDLTFPSPLPTNFSKAAEYCIDVNVGGKPFCLDLDTGSSDIGIMGNGCKGCPRKKHDAYNPGGQAQATTCQFCKANKGPNTDLTCGRDGVCVMNMEYDEGSGFSAALYEDDFSFKGAEDKNFTMVVGEVIKAKGFDDPRDVDGIIGFGDKSESAAGVDSAFATLVMKQGVEDIFSLCLRPDHGVAYLGAEPGVTDAKNVVWTKRLPNNGLYTVGLKDVLVGGKSIGASEKSLNKGDAIVDSGTSDSCFSDTAMDLLKKGFKQYCKDSGVNLKGLCDKREEDEELELDLGKRGKADIFEDKCVEMSEDDRAKYPTITLKYQDGTQTEHTHKGYLRNDEWLCDFDYELGRGRGRKDNSNKWTIGISSCGEDGSGALIGVTLMSEHVVLFDRGNSRIGWLEGHEECP